jgi:hypothetical protein
MAAPAPAAATYQHPERAGSSSTRIINLKILALMVLGSPWLKIVFFIAQERARSQGENTASWYFEPNHHNILDSMDLSCLNDLHGFYGFSGFIAGL